MYHLLWRLLEDLPAGNGLSPFLGLPISALLISMVVAYANDGYLGVPAGESQESTED